MKSIADHPIVPAATELIASSPAMQRILDWAQRAAASEATVLIQGETGTGKELIARTIHQHSPRCLGPFVAVNCGAYTDSLLASELFGHTRGAFTGAVRDHAGVFEVASGGTVFLDEIGTMSPQMQIKLLRVIQERTVQRVGTSEEIAVNCRIVAATNADLAGLVSAGQFREDLYYRIKVASCRIPPLRERRQDIEPLIDHYWSYFLRRSGKLQVHLAPATRQALLAYDWPGNVRQLCGEVEQLIALAEAGRPVQLDDLSEELRQAATAGSSTPCCRDSLSGPVESVSAPAGDATYQELLDVWTKQVVADRLARCGGNITTTAKSLAISRTTLYALLKKYGLHGE